MISDCNGALDFDGLPYAMALYGVTEDLHLLLHRLNVIKMHRPTENR